MTTPCIICVVRLVPGFYKIKKFHNKRGEICKHSPWLSDVVLTTSTVF